MSLGTLSSVQGRGAGETGGVTVTALLEDTGSSWSAQAFLGDQLPQDHKVPPTSDPSPNVHRLRLEPPSPSASSSRGYLAASPQKSPH